MKNKFMQAFFLTISIALPLTSSLFGATVNWAGPGTDMTVGTNWVGATVPSTTDVGNFAGALPLTPTVSQSGVSTTFNVQGISFNGVSSYAIDIDALNVLNGAEVSVGNSGGAGVQNSSGLAQTFNVVRGGTLSFLPGSSADVSGSGLVTYTIGTNTDGVSSTLVFDDATASNSTINLNGSLANPAIIQFEGTTTETFFATLNGTAGSAITKNGPGTLVFIAPNPTFAGETLINGGNFNLNGILGGNVNVLTGILSGNGEIGGNLSVQGIISPGNSIGTIVDGGNYIQGPTGVFAVQVNGSGQSSLIVVEGTTTLSGIVEVISLDGVINPANNYVILHSEGKLSGTFEAVIANNNRFVGQVFYIPEGTATNVILKIESVFTFVAESSNELTIAEQLLSIVNPSSQIDAVLDGIALLAAEDPALARAVLDQLSGQQYTNTIIEAEIANHQFLRRLYDPIRSIVTTYPCCEDDCCESCPTFDLWLESGGGRTFLAGSSNARGFHMNGYEVTGGAQSTFLKEWTIGLAGSYAQDNVSYNVGGSGKNRTGFVGLYGLYRPANFYVLADGAFGYTENKLRRFISVGTTLFSAHSKPKIYQGSGYIEAGIDCPWNCMLLQPFLGFEAGYYNRNGITETGLSPFNLNVVRKTHTNVFSRLGAHLTTTQFLPYNLTLSVDLAWQYRITDLGNSITENFQTFGDTFTIKGLHFRRSSVDAAVTLSAVVWDNLEVYAEMSGEGWSRASTYNFLGGVKFTW